MAILFWISLSLIFYTYIIYPLFIVIISKFFPQNTNYSLRDYPTVAMVIPAYNEDNCLQEKINNCLEIDYPNNRIEFVFGSDGSSDGTNRILNSNSNPAIRGSIFSEREGKIKVLNKLISGIDAEIILLSDANTIYQSGSVKKLVSHFVDQRVGGVCGKLNLINPSSDPGGKGENLYWRYENLIKEAEGQIGSVISANGAIFAIRRALYEPLPEDIIVNDDFSNTLNIIQKNKRVIYEPQAIAEENTSPNMGGEFLRKVRISSLNFNAIPELIQFLNPRYGFTALALLSHKILRWMVPFFAFGMLISNILILNQGILYPFFLIGQMIIYLGALLGFLGDKFWNKSGPFLIFYYLATVNIAMIIGLWRSLTGAKEQTWDRVPH
jgi:biofilm PGA synthesis N-glycosyltransferase PgaC